MLSRMQREYRRNATHRWNVKTGATRSGKTYGDYFIIPKRIMAGSGKPGLNVILGNTKGTLQRNIIQPLQDLYGPSLVSDIRSDNTATLFGETAYCLGADNVRHVNRLRGSSIKYCYGDEVTTWHQDVFDMLKSRLDKPYSLFDGTCNPAHPTHWFKTFLDGNADIYQQAYTIDDNPFLAPEFVANLKREYTGTVYYDRYILGLWAVADGLIYPHFARCVTDSLPDQFDRYIVSMDYGIQNATAMILWGRRAGVWYAIREYYHSGRESREQKTDDDYWQAYIELTNGLRISRLIIDPSAASFIVLARRRGAPVMDADNDVLDGIRETSTAMQRGRIKVSRQCKQLALEAQGYMWDAKKAKEQGEERPVKANDHLMDALRYFVRTVISEKNTAIAVR